MSPPASAAARALNAPAPARRPTRSAPAPNRRPRRVSGPAPARTAPRRTAPARGVASRPAPLGLASRALGRAVSLDRLLRTRVWIGVIAFALIGIVTMQLVLLKLNTGIGNALERTSALQRENSALSVAVSEAGSAEAIENEARSAGMLPLPPGQLHFLTAGGAATARDAAKALRAGKVGEGSGISAVSSEAASTSSAAASTTTTEGEATTTEGEATTTEGEAVEGEAAVSEQPEGEASVEAAAGEAPPEETSTVTPTYTGTPETGEGTEATLAAGGGVQAGAGG